MMLWPKQRQLPKQSLLQAQTQKVPQSLKLRNKSCAQTPWGVVK
jgi:hypothetical protein